MRTVNIILFCLAVCAFQQVQAQKRILSENRDITLVSEEWTIGNNCENDYCTLKGKYKMVNNLNKKIIITKTRAQKNNTYIVEPFVPGMLFGDSLVLQPREQKEFTYQSSSFLSRYPYPDIESFFKFTQLDIADNNRTRIAFDITYYIDGNQDEIKIYNGDIFLGLDNLMDFPEELTDSLIPFVDEQRCDKYKSYVEWEKKMRRGDQVMNIREWGGTLFEQRICPCIKDKK